MQKEALREDMVREDLKGALAERVKNESNHRLSFLLPLAGLAVFFGSFTGNLLLGAILFLPGLYHLFRYAAALRKDWLCKKAIDQGAWEWSHECLSHIRRELIYEPHYGRRMPHLTKEILFFYFRSGKRFRVPRRKHYSRSREVSLSTQGLENLSSEGDAFFLVYLSCDPHLAYGYPCKLFTAGDFEKE